MDWAKKEDEHDVGLLDETRLCQLPFGPGR